MPEIFIISITLLSFVYFLILQILENALNKIQIPTVKKKSGKNKVSVIVCARNEEKNLPELFNCLGQQKIDSIDVEFIIVNDRSDDKTAKLIDAPIMSKIISLKINGIKKNANAFAILGDSIDVLAIFFIKPNIKSTISN